MIPNFNNYMLSIFEKKNLGDTVDPHTPPPPPLPTPMHHMNLSFGAYLESVVATLFIMRKKRSPTFSIPKLITCTLKKKFT